MASWTDPFAPQPIPGDDPTTSPWGWVPPEWDEPAQPGELQPGLVVPAAALEQAVGPGPGLPPVIESPAPIASSPSSAPTLGAPADDNGPQWPPAHWRPTPIAVPAEPMHEPDEPDEPDEIDMSEGGFSDYAGDPLQNPDQDAAIDTLVGMSGEGFARVQAKHDAARAEQMYERQLVEARRNREEHEMNERARVDGTKKAQAAAEQLEIEAKQLASERLDGDRWWGNASTGKKIFSFILAIAGGLTQSRRGGPNEGLAMIEREIDRDIEEQKFNLGQRRSELTRRQGVVADMFARTNDEFRAAEGARHASWEVAIQAMQAEAQNYDPRGTTALRIADTIRQARARQMELFAKYSAEEQKRLIEAEKAQLEKDKFAEQKRHAKQQEAIAWAGRANEKRRLALDEAQGERKMAQEDRKLDLEVQKLEREGKKVEAKELRELGIGGLPTIERDAEGNPLVDDKGNPKYSRGGALVQEDGKTIFKAPTPEVAEELRKKVAAARDLNEILAEIMDIRDKVGGESDVWNSDEKLRLDVLKNKAVLVMKAGTHGLSSDADLKRIEETLGVESVKSFRARAAGLEEARERVNKSLHKELEARGYSGKQLEFTQARDLKRPEDTEEERAYKAAITKPSLSITEAENEAMSLARAEANRRRRMGTLPDLPPSKDPKENTGRALMSDEGREREKYTAFLLAEKKRLAAGYKDIGPNQRATIEKLGYAMKYGKTPVEKQRARDWLLEAADKAATEAQRDKARQMLQLYGGE